MNWIWPNEGVECIPDRRKRKISLLDLDRWCESDKG